MRYIDHGNGGPPSVMKLATGPKPSPKPGEVLIEVAYAGVNRPDVLQRSGSYPPPPGASPLLGLEVAGRIVEVAADVTEWKVGDTVCALTPGGGYAEFCATPAAHCLPIPKGLSAKDAGSLPENWFTVYDNVMTRGRLKAGETILIHGGSGGIGYSAIQLAKVLGGATVYTTVGSAEGRVLPQDGCRRCLELQRRGLGGRGGEADREARRRRRPRHGRGRLPNAQHPLARARGRLVQIAFLKENKIADFDAMPIMLKRLTFTGSTLRPRTVEQKAAIAQPLREHVWPLFESGQLKTFVYKTFPLADASAAHELMEARSIGKIMLAVRGG